MNYINELLAKADMGDVSAMIAVGDYYLDKNNSNQGNLAMEYYEKAANASGNIEAILKLIVQLPIDALACEMIGNYTGAESAYRRLEQWTYRIITLESNGQKVLDQLHSDLRIMCFDYYRDATYGIASCIYLRKGDLCEALEWIINSKDTKSMILEGLITYELALIDMRATKQADVASIEKLKSAYGCLKVIEQDDVYLRNNKTETEEIILAVATLRLSNIYGSGIPPAQKPDNNKAASVLRRVTQYISGEQRRDALIRELSRI